jgi:hypothetical protein
MDRLIGAGGLPQVSQSLGNQRIHRQSNSATEEIAPAEFTAVHALRNAYPVPDWKDRASLIMSWSERLSGSDPILRLHVPADFQFFKVCVRRQTKLNCACERGGGGYRFSPGPFSR